MTFKAIVGIVLGAMLANNYQNGNVTMLHSFSAI